MGGISAGVCASPRMHERTSVVTTICCSFEATQISTVGGITRTRSRTQAGGTSGLGARGISSGPRSSTSGTVERPAAKLRSRAKARRRFSRASWVRSQAAGRSSGAGRRDRRASRTFRASIPATLNDGRGRSTARGATSARAGRSGSAGTSSPASTRTRVRVDCGSGEAPRLWPSRRMIRLAAAGWCPHDGVGGERRVTTIRRLRPSPAQPIIRGAPPVSRSVR
jgi:hypothetical protein